MATELFNSPKEGLKQTQILHMSMTGGLILMFIAMWFAVGEGSAMRVGSRIYQILPALLLGLIGLSFYLYKSRVSQASDLKDTMEKVGHYRASSIMRWALIEGAGLTSVLFYFFFVQNHFFLVTFVIALIAMVFSRPSESQFASDYNLTNQEITTLK
jgi:hypothetical protein